MKKIIMLFVYSVLMAFNACDNNTDNELSDATPEFLLAASNVKKWELIDPTVEIKVGDKIPVIKPTAPEGLVDNGLGYFYFIFLDNTIRFQDGYGETKEDVSLEHGCWEFTDTNKQSIKITWADRVEIWNIKTLTPSILEIETNGITQTFAPTIGNP